MNARGRAFFLTLVALSMVALGCLRLSPDEALPEACTAVPFAELRYEPLLDFEAVADALEDEDVRVRRVGHQGENLSLAFGNSWGPEAQNVQAFVRVWYEGGFTNKSTLVDFIYRGEGARALPAGSASDILRPFVWRTAAILNETLPGGTQGLDSHVFDTRVICA